MGSGKRKRAKLQPSKVPVFLFTALTRKELGRAVDRGRLRATKGEPIALYERRGRAARDVSGPCVMLRIAARYAAETGVAFVKGPRGRFEAVSSIPLTVVACANLPRSIRNVERVDAAGGVVATSGDRPRVLLLLKGREQTGRWVLPKGKRRRLEPRRRAARREVLEESGLSRVDVGKFLLRERYFDKEGGRVVFKQVSYYLMRVPKGKTRLKVSKTEGFSRGSWVSFASALEMTNPARAHRTLRRARAAVKA